MNDYLEIFEEFSDELEIKYLIADKLEGSDFEGYLCVYIDDDSFSRKILTELGFKKIENDLYYKKLEKFDEIKNEDIEDLKLYFSDKYSKKAKRNEYRKRIVKLKKVWDNISDKIYEINHYFMKEYEMDFFTPTLETLDLSMKLTNIIVTNDRSWGKFCYSLYQYGYESIFKETHDKLAELLQKKYPNECKTKNDSKKFLKERFLENDPFYCQIDRLRHYEIHLIQKTVEEKDEKFINAVKQFYLNRIKKLPTNDFEFFLLQMRMLKDFDNFLNKIYTIITTKI